MHGAPGRVLVVDDNKVIRQLIRVNLELEGFEVVTAADGAECLEIVHQVQPDVVTLDVAMPRVDGLGATALLRADPRLRHVRILLVSGCPRLETEGGALAGADAFLGKPFEPAELVGAVWRLLRGAHRFPVDSGRLLHSPGPGPAPGVSAGAGPGVGSGSAPWSTAAPPTVAPLTEPPSYL